MEVHFSPRGLGRRVLGTSESIEAMTVGRMRDYFRARYRPENIVVAASGNVDFDALVEGIDRQTRDWQDRRVAETLPGDAIATLPAGILMDRQVATPDALQAYSIQIGGGPSSASQDRHAARLLATILGDEGGSRFFWELIDTGRAEVATCWPQEFSDCGAWFTYLVCHPDDLESNRRLLNQIVQRVVAGGVSEDELNQAINKTTAGTIMQSERPSNRLFGLGSRWLMHGEHVDLDQSLDRIRSVTRDDVHRVAQEYLSAKPTEIVAIAE